MSHYCFCNHTCTSTVWEVVVDNFPLLSQVSKDSVPTSRHEYIDIHNKLMCQ